MPKISVIIPIYNVGSYLENCLNSLLSQTEKDWEGICVNDGSTDNCADILERYARKDQRFKIITQKNQGLSMARNNGLEKASGEYIYFLDSDDAMHPQLLEFSLKTAQKYQVDLVCFQYRSVSSCSAQPALLDYKKQKIKITENPLLFTVKRKNYHIAYNVWSKFYRKDLLKDLRFIPNIHFEDYPHTYILLARKPKTAILNTPLYFYINRSTNISNQQDTPQRIKDYATGVFSILDVYQGNALLKKEFSFLKHNFLPSVLNQQYKKFLKVGSQKRQEMLKVFAEELIKLQNKGLLSWRGHKIKRYFAYKRLIKNYKKEEE